MNDRTFSVLLVAIVAVMGASVFVLSSGSSAPTAAQVSRISNQNPLDWGVYPQQQYPLTGYQRQISIGKCKLQGVCKAAVGADSRCPGQETLFENGFMTKCLSFEEGQRYRYCAHKAVGGYYGDAPCWTASENPRDRKDCVCV